ncbi:hypothetical protein PEXP_098420 [Penicillium expansum]|nr:hypothetical protein PEXP_098420 [Penicillium expansum]
MAPLCSNQTPLRLAREAATLSKLQGEQWEEKKAFVLNEGKIEIKTFSERVRVNNTPRVDTQLSDDGSVQRTLMLCVPPVSSAMGHNSTKI